MVCRVKYRKTPLRIAEPIVINAKFIIEADSGWFLIASIAFDITKGTKFVKTAPRTIIKNPSQSFFLQRFKYGINLLRYSII